MRVLKVKVIYFLFISQVLYVLCFTRSRYQVSVYRTNGPLVVFPIDCMVMYVYNCVFLLSFEC